nr:hypothetical protein [Tanacetum cinerariifolium]
MITSILIPYYHVKVKENQEKDKIGTKSDKNGKRGEAERSQKRVVPRNYDPKGERFSIASRFPTPPLACVFFSPGASVTNCSCSKGNVEDKILVPKLSENCARCAKCGHPVNGPYCQGCALLREKLKEDLVTYIQNFKNISESSDDITNVVNAPREPVVVKQDHGVNPPHIDECSCECGNALDGIFCQQCTCKSCGKGAHTGYNCPPKVPIISNQEPCIQTMNNELPQTLPSFDTTCYSDKENSKQEKKQIEEEQAAKARYWKIPACCDDDDDYNSTITPVLSTEGDQKLPKYGDKHLDTIPATESDEVIKSSVDDLVPIPSESEGIPDTMCDVHFINNPTPLEAKDHFEIVMNFNDDVSSSDDDSLYNENIEYVEAPPHDFEVVSLEVAEIVIPKEEDIEDDNLHEKLLNVHLLISNIEALKDNPTPSSKLLTKSSSTSPKSFLEETNTFHNSLPEFENFYFDLEEICSTTTHSDISLSKYDSSDFTHEEFADELAHIISPPEYDCFYFRDLPDPGELMYVLNFGIRENLSSTTCVNLPIEDDYSPLLAYVVWIFLAYLTYPVIPPYLHPFGNEDTIFDPGITINHFCSFKPGLSHRCGAFKKFNTHRSHLNKWPMIINGKNIPILDLSSIPGNFKTLAKGSYPPSLNFLSFNWEL